MVRTALAVGDSWFDLAMGSLAVFDGSALIGVLDAQRADRGLSWTALAKELSLQSSDLNAELADDSLCPGALGRTALRGTMSCQYALILLRWVNRPPEDFLTGPVVEVRDVQLPEAGPDRRLRWDLSQLHASLNAQRCDHGLTWSALADEIGCTPGRLTNLRTARRADMGLTMRVTQWMKDPAAKFVHPARW